MVIERGHYNLPCRILLLLLEFKETVGLLTNSKSQFGDPKRSTLPIRWMYPGSSKADWRVTGEGTTVARGRLLFRHTYRHIY